MPEWLPGWLMPLVQLFASDAGLMFWLGHCSGVWLVYWLLLKPARDLHALERKMMLDLIHAQATALGIRPTAKEMIEGHPDEWNPKKKPSG